MGDTAVDGKGNTVVAACVRESQSDPPFSGNLTVGRVSSRTSIDWSVPNPNTVCGNVGLDPADPNHLIYTSRDAPNVSNTFVSFDGGRTVRWAGHPTAAFYASIDGAGWYYTGAEAGAFFSADRGATWAAFVVNMTAPDGNVVNRIPHDYQSIAVPFGDDGVAFPSDQGLFVMPQHSAIIPGQTTPLINANGDMSNNIAIKPAVSQGSSPDGPRSIVTTMWDWAPTASWDGGASWLTTNHWVPYLHPLTTTTTTTVAPTTIPPAPAPPPPPSINGAIMTKYNRSCSSTAGGNFWLARTALSTLGINLTAMQMDGRCGHTKSGWSTDCGSFTFNGQNNVSCVAINPSDGFDACGTDGGAGLAYVQIAKGESANLKFGTAAKIAWDQHPGPPAPPAPPPPAPPGRGGAPGRVGEGGAAYALGASNVVIMLHYNNIYRSEDGGRNFTYYSDDKGNSLLPEGSNAHSSDLCYLRAPGSRTEPAGPVFTVIGLPATATTSDVRLGSNDDGDDNVLKYMPYGGIRDQNKDHGWLEGIPGTPALLKSPDFGKTWTWIEFPARLEQTAYVATSPDDPTTLYAVAPHCIATSVDQGETWGDCWKNTNFTGAGFAALFIKDSNTMIATRSGADVPLRTRDGGKRWVALNNLKNQSTGTQFAAAYSWSGGTLVVHGRNPAAPAQGRYPTFVLSSRDDGDSWCDEAAGLVTMSPASGSWYDEDFYLSSAGEGIMVKRGLDAA